MVDLTLCDLYAKVKVIYYGNNRSRTHRIPHYTNVIDDRRTQHCSISATANYGRLKVK